MSWDFVRGIARGLMPVEVNPESLATALTELAENIHQAFNLRCSFACPEPVLVEDSVKATHLFCIAREAATNAAKHAQATAVQMRLEATPDRVILETVDDGVGFSEPKTNQGLGLLIMRNRAAVLRADLRFKAAQPRGTVVTCTLKRSRHGTERDSRSRSSRADRG